MTTRFRRLRGTVLAASESTETSRHVQGDRRRSPTGRGGHLRPYLEDVGFRLAQEFRISRRIQYYWPGPASYRKNGLRRWRDRIQVILAPRHRENVLAWRFGKSVWDTHFTMRVMIFLGRYNGVSERRPAATVQLVAAPTRALSLDEFARKHGDWSDMDQPAYCFPYRFIACLQKSRGRRPAILTHSEAAAENDFLQLCKTHSAIGIWQRRTVLFRCLQRPEPPPTREEMRRVGHSDQQIVATEQRFARTAEIWLRLKGYVGWLLTDRQFHADRDRLAASWNGLDDAQRPSFPLQRSVRAEQLPPNSQRASDSLSEFQCDVDAFLDHWGLMSMVTWDLPKPQGPLIPVQMPKDAQAMPRHGLHIVLPVHYPLLGSDELLLEIQQQQIELARQHGLDTSLTGLPHHEVLGQMFELDHLERAVRSRYEARTRRAGFVGHLEDALADHLGVAVSHVKRLRKGISACKRGRRESVSWLRRRAGILTG